MLESLKRTMSYADEAGSMISFEIPVFYFLMIIIFIYTVFLKFNCKDKMVLNIGHFYEWVNTLSIVLGFILLIIGIMLRYEYLNGITQASEYQPTNSIQGIYGLLLSLGRMAILFITIRLTGILLPRMVEGILTWRQNRNAEV
mgnify:CR=1 FL=1